MYEQLSKKITDILIRNKIISEKEKEIYIYSFQIILSSFVSTLFIIIWSLLFKQIFNTIIFFIGFFLCRKFSGGYHAKSSLGCFIFTQTLFISYLSLISFTNILESKLAFILITLFTNIIILTFAPIDNENKPFSEDEKVKFRKKSRILSLINIIIVFISVYFSLFISECFCYILGTFSVSIMLILGKIQNITSLKHTGKIYKKGEICNEKT